MVSDPHGYVPPEAIVGVFPVDADGRATGEFVRNPRYGPVRDDLTRLKSPDHWLGRLPDTPAAAVRASIEEVLTDQVPGSVLHWVKITGEPAFLTGGRPQPDDPTRVTVTRAGLAAPFALAVTPPTGRREILTGVFTWVAVSLDTPDSRRDQVWFDPKISRDRGEHLLRQRIYEPDPPP